jgi:hypothetical protein
MTIKALQMGDESLRVCSACQAAMGSITVMDRYYVNNRYTQELEYRLPEDKLSFWTGKYPTAGKIQAFMCSSCGKIDLYGTTAPGSAP